MNTEGILWDVKQSLGIQDECFHFDNQLLMCINSVFSSLTQLGVGPTEGFYIDSSNSDDITWNDYIGEEKLLNFVKQYVCLRTRLLFDPPTSSIVNEAIKNQIEEIEYRILVVVDVIKKEDANE